MYWRTNEFERRADMALTETARGTVTNQAGATTCDVSPSSNCTAGALVLLAVSYDNAGTNGADPFSSITDTHSNTWTSRVAVLNDPGAANEGLVLRLFETYQDAGQLNTSDTVTLTFSTSVTAKVCTFTQLSGSTGTPTYVASGTATGTSSTPSITTDSIASGDYVFGATGQEGGGAQTGDSDTTNGSWSAQQHVVTNLTGVGNQGITTQGKVTTGTGTQSYDTTINNTRDWAILWAQYTEVTTSLSPTRSLSIPPAIICM